MSTMKFNIFVFTAILGVMAAPAFSLNPYPAKLIVVQDRGGTSAQPYFEEAGLTLDVSDVSAVSEAPPVPGPVTEEVMMPVGSTRLSPGPVVSRPMQAPGLTPLFIVGDDELSRQWLVSRASALKQMNAVGLVVNVSSRQRLNALRALVPELVLSPVAGDDIAVRLGLVHYPVLITATAIEQ